MTDYEVQLAITQGMIPIGMPKEYNYDAAIKTTAAESALEAKKAVIDGKAEVSQLIASGSNAINASVALAKQYSDDSKASSDNAALSASKAETEATKSENSYNKAKAEAEKSAASATLSKNSEDMAKQYADSVITVSGSIAAPAWSAESIYNYPDVVAYTDGCNYRCIGTNIDSSSKPSESTSWVCITQMKDDFFEIDEQGDSMPAENPRYSASWTLDTSGDMMTL